MKKISYFIVALFLLFTLCSFNVEAGENEYLLSDAELQNDNLGIVTIVKNSSSSNVGYIAALEGEVFNLLNVGSQILLTE